MFREQWPREKTEILKERWGRGFSQSLIARELQITRSAVAGKISRLELAHRMTQLRLDISRKPKPRKHNRPKARMYIEQMARQPPWEQPKSKPTGKPVPILKLEAHHCRWPVGEPKDLLYCGKRKIDGSSYCLDHHRKAHTGYGSHGK